MKITLRHSLQITRYLILRLFSEGLTYRAASLAYATTLAIVPILIAIFTILAYFPVFLDVGKQIQHLVVSNFVAGSATLISQHLNNFVKNAHKLSSVNIAFLIILDVLMLYNIHRAFNAIWHTKPNWHFSLSFLAYFIILFLSPLVFGGLLILGTFLYKLPLVAYFITDAHIKRPLFVLLPHLITFVTFTVCNWVLPSCRVKFTHALLGGILTTIIFELAKNLFAFYFNHFHTYRELYGTLATVPLFLVWLYVSWLIILLGALVTNVIAVGIPKNWSVKLRK